LKVNTIDEAERHATHGKLSTRRSSSGPWQFLGFNDTTAAAVFFTSGGSPIQDADSIFQHQPLSVSLAEVWLEGGAELTQLLLSLGARVCGDARAPDGRTGQRLALSKGSVVLVLCVNARGREFSARYSLVEIAAPR
jgi:hypothetical protein